MARQTCVGGSRRAGKLCLLAGLLAACAMGPCLAAGPAGRAGEAQARVSARRPGPGQRAGPAGFGPVTDFNSALANWNTFYKRSLYSTKRGAGDRPRWPLQNCREAWYRVLDSWYVTPPPEYAKDERWHQDLATITGYLHMAEWLAWGGDLEGAHEALDPVRRIWMEIRTRNGIRHFGDELTRYYDVMEPIVDWGVGASHGGVTKGNLGEYEAELAKLAAAWQSVTQFGFRPSNPMWGRRFYMSMVKEAQAISGLFEAVSERRFEEIPAAAEEVKAGFLQLYMGFG